MCFNSSKLPGLQPKGFCASQRVQDDPAFIWILRIKEALERVFPIRFGSVLNSSAQNDALLVAWNDSEDEDEALRISSEF